MDELLNKRLKKFSTTQLQRKLRENTCSTPEEKDLVIQILESRNINMTEFHGSAPLHEDSSEEVVEDSEVDQEEPEPKGVSFQYKGVSMYNGTVNTVEEALALVSEDDSLMSEATLKKVDLLITEFTPTDKEGHEVLNEISTLISGADNLGELTEGIGLKIISLITEYTTSKASSPKKPFAKPSNKLTEDSIEIDSLLTPERKLILDDLSLKKADKIRKIYRSGVTEIKVIKKLTGFDYTQVYDTVKAFEKILNKPA